MRDFDDSERNAADPDGLTNSGPEVVSNPSVTDLVLGRRGDPIGLDDQGMHREREEFLEELDKQFSEIEPALIVKSFEKAVLGKFRASFYDGIQIPELVDTAVEPKVGITFMAGADTPQVNLLEMMGMTEKEPDQKDGVWRVKTAGTLLKSFEVDRDLYVVQTDNTATVVANARHRQKAPEGPFYERGSPKTALVTRGREDRTVTIDSDNVKIVNDLSEGKWDMEATLIEVDGSSLVALITNYRHLIQRTGPALTFTATVKLLDTMIEDARRLCVRSPILFRMSIRRHIISSKNTRYGVDAGTMFQTLTTSSGIKNIIARSAAYFNSLSSSGDIDKSQGLIRTRFLQMLVLLLALLNDDDLGEISEFLETTYQINAERQHIELLILKVLPLMSINSKIFLHAMVAAFEGPTAVPHPTDQPAVWNHFVQQTLQLKYVLPGSVEQLGQPDLSWVPKWPKGGLKDSSVFNNLQYSGTSRAINDIPPMNIHFDTTTAELTVILTNGRKYLVHSADVEDIRRMTPGKYSITEAIESTSHPTTSSTGGRTFDLEISESVVTDTLHKAINRLNSVLVVLNPFIASSRRKSGVLQRFSNIRVSSGNGNNNNREPQHDSAQPFPQLKGSGKLTFHNAILHDQYLAMAYKIEGRKIRRRDLIRSLGSDLRNLRHTLRAVDSTVTEFVAGRRTSLGPEYKQKLLSLRQTLVEVAGLMKQAEEKKDEMESHVHQLGDEPVGKILFPSGAETNENQVWHDYEAWFVKSDNVLYVEAQRKVVQRVIWVSDEILEITFHDQPTKFFVSPLKADIEEHERDDELKQGDRVMLVGQYMVVVEALEEAQNYAQNGYGHIQQQDSIRRVPVPAPNHFPQVQGQRHNGFTPLHGQNGLQHEQGREQNYHSYGPVHGQHGYSYAPTHGQLSNNYAPAQGQFGNDHAPAQGQFGNSYGPPQAQPDFRYVQRPAEPRNGHSQNRFGHGQVHSGSVAGQGHQGGEKTPMATEAMVNWLRITAVEQQTAGRRGQNRQKAASVQRSAIR